MLSLLSELWCPVHGPAIVAGLLGGICWFRGVLTHPRLFGLRRRRHHHPHHVEED